MDVREEHLDLDPQLQALEAELAELLRADDAPAHLAERIITATDGGLDQRLKAALHVAPPAGLSQRIFAATAPHLPAAQPVIAGRIRFSATFIRFASAACLAALVGGAVWLQVQHNRTERNFHSPAAIAERLNRIELAMASVPLDPVESQVAALALDVEQAAWNVRVEPVNDMLEVSTDGLSDQLDMLENELGQW